MAETTANNFAPLSCVTKTTACSTNHNMDGPSLPRSIRWRLQLGLLRLSAKNGGDDEENVVSVQKLYEFNTDLLQQQRQHYSDLIQRHQERLVVAADEQVEEEEEGMIEDSPQKRPEQDTMLDPLTAMVREQEAQEQRRRDLDLKYRKERARRKRGIYEGEGGDGGGDGDTQAAASHLQFEVIDKDLHRLPPDHHTYHHSRKRLSEQAEKEDTSFDASVKERTVMLAEILQLYTLEHSTTLGYRQGMHEIASYLLLVLEMDLYDWQVSLQSTCNQEEEAFLLDATYLRHDAYGMLERVMGDLAPAYDVTKSPSHISPMEDMALSVVNQIKEVAGDVALYQVLNKISCPPQLYCTKWIRLMFSREVLGWRNVLLLWDVFFDLISCCTDITSMDATKYKLQLLGCNNFTLMQVLESTAASLILLQRDALLQTEDPNESIHLLMNLEPLTNIVPLTATLVSMMRRQHASTTTSDLTSSMASLTLGGIGQMARGAMQQIAPTTESLRKLYDSATTSAASTPTTSRPSKQESTIATTTNLPIKNDPLSGVTTPSKAHTPQRHVQRVANGSAKQLPSPAIDPSSSALMAATLKESTSSLTEFFMQLKANGENVPEEVWEALSKVEAVRNQLL